MIRQATWLDAYAVSLMWGKMIEEITTRLAMRKEASNIKNFFLRLLVKMEAPDWRVLVAEEPDGTLMGFIMGYVHFPLYHDCHRIGTCEALYVVPESRGQKLHQTLIDELITWAKKNEATEFEFLTSYDPKMIRFYDDLGYEPVQVVLRQKEV